MLVLSALALAASSPQAAPVPGRRPLRTQAKNAIVIVVDDWGLDMLESYGTPDFSSACLTRPPTPNIDALAQTGVTFLNAWVQPVCSPTRASLLTGRQPFRHKLGQIVDPCSAPSCPTGDQLADTEFTFPEMLREAANVGLLPNYGSAAIGKWHLGPDPMGPMIQGFDRFRGTTSNIGKSNFQSETYCSWLKNTDGVLGMSQTYATTDSINEALSFIGDQGDDPWFLYLAMHSGHAPYHIPPPHLAPSYFIDDGLGGCFHAQTPHCPPLPPQVPPVVCPTTVCDGPFVVGLNEPRLDQIRSRRPYYEAMIEAMDTEIGRLIAGVNLRETIVFIMGDNGSPGGVTSPPFIGDRVLGIPPKAKGTAYQGGVNVPFIVAGAGVRGARQGRTQRTSRQMVHVVDVYATIAELFGVGAVELSAITPNELDSRSFRAILAGERARGRDTLFSEWFSPNFPTAKDSCSLTSVRTIRNRRYKLIRTTDPFNCAGPPQEVLFDLGADPLEANDLMAAGAHLAAGVVRTNYLWLASELDAVPLP